MTVREARRAFFARSGLDERGYRAAWVRFKLGPLPVIFPNTAGRRRAAPLHDLHHVATGYRTDLRGEAEIAAWELAAGCGDYAAAWVLDGLTLALGLVLAPRRVLRAWRRGRRCRSLYTLGSDERLLDETVGALRRRLALA
jgi:ubiquinone biosynthesis protein Coq4